MVPYLLMVLLFFLEPKRPCMKMIGLPFSSPRGASWRSKLRGDTVADEYGLLRATTANDASLVALDGDLSKCIAIFTSHATLDAVVGSGYHRKSELPWFLRLIFPTYIIPNVLIGGDCFVGDKENIT